MAANDKVTLRDVYDRFDRFDERIDDRFKELRNEFVPRFERIENRTSVLERLNDNLMGKISAALFFVSIVLNLAIEFVKERLTK